MKQNIKYSIVIPVFNSEKSVKNLAIRIKSTFNKIDNTDYEILFVNDSPYSKNTCNALNEIKKNDDKVTVIELTKNFGQQAATLCGIDHATGDYVITMDDDLQHLPEKIPSFIKLQHHDIVIASFKKNKNKLFTKLSSNIKGYFDYLLIGKPKNIKLTSYRLIHIKIAKMMLERKTPYPFIPALLFSITHDVVNIKIDHQKRYDGKGNYSFLKRLKLFSNLIINNSSFLLRFIGYVGISISITSFIFGIQILIKKLFFEVTISGWTSIMLVSLFLGGMILFTLGIVGEYLARIIATSETRPIYFIRNINK